MAKKTNVTSTFDIEEICTRIEKGLSLTKIAAEYGCDLGVLNAWLAKDAQRSARAREARSLAAYLWDEKAETTIAAATGPLELAKAKELAHHYRWRASKTSPVYAERQQVEHTGKVSLENLVTGCGEK